MVNRHPNEHTQTEIERLIAEGEFRAWCADNAGKPDCAEQTRKKVRMWRAELRRRRQVRAELFSLGAAAVLSPTGI
jgi:hypothetical protein